MIGRAGDLFAQTDVDAICLTTNGAVRRDGAAVMGRGVAAEAKKRWPGIEYYLGRLIEEEGGNVVHILSMPSRDIDDKPTPAVVTMLSKDHPSARVKPYFTQSLPYHVVAFPVKHHWKDRADLLLIQKSAEQLVELTNSEGWKKVALVRPGCGNGQLEWDVVRPLIEPILDNRFVVVQI